MKATVLYYSKSGNTKKMAEKILEGINSVEGIEAKSFSIDELDDEWLKESKCIILGTPTYYATTSAHVNAFMEDMGKYNLSGKLGGGFATENYVHGGGESAVSTILTYMMCYGMVVYSGGGACGNPTIHLGPVGVKDQYEKLEENFVLYGKRMGQKALELF